MIAALYTIASVLGLGVGWGCSELANIRSQLRRIADRLDHRITNLERR
jgi:hypothetical protein